MERRCKDRKPAASEEPRVHDVPDDLLRLILLRLDSPLWLVRAACACKRWRRVVDGGDGGRAFLRLARSLHPPVVVGRYHNRLGPGRRFVASSPTPIGLSSSLNFFHFPLELEQRIHANINGWHVADCHGGLVLLRNGLVVVSDLVVYDPLSRQCRDIHHPLDKTSRLPMGEYLPQVFLLDGGGDDGNISISNFRVLYGRSTYPNVSEIFIFSTADGGGWRLLRRQSTAAFDDDLIHICMGYVIGRIDRSVYLASATKAGSVRVLDNANARLELSEVHLPTRMRKSGSDDTTFAVVHGGSPEPTASPATAFIVHVRGNDLELFRRTPSSGEWVLEHSIPRLSEATRGLQGYPVHARWGAVDIIAGGTRLAVLKVPLKKRGYRNWWLFSLDVDTMQLQVVPDEAAYRPLERKPEIYTLPWPQFLTALPT